MEIRQLIQEAIPDAAEIIRQSFRTVADDFNLTPENCPSHPAFLTEAQLRIQVEAGLQLFGSYAGDVLAGVVGIKPVKPCEFSIEKLAVLPAYRHRRFGARLMAFACEYVLQAGGEQVSIGIVDENTVLKQWYQRQGFAVTEIKRFPHLPFTVCLMERTLDSNTNHQTPVSASPLILRRYQPGDETAVCELHEKALRQVHAYLPGPWNDDLQDIAGVYIDNGGDFLVGVIDDRIVAMGAFRRIDARCAEIKRMRVDPAYQGRGYGRTLLCELEARAREMGYEILRLNTTTQQTAAMHLYRTQGYDQTGTTTFKALQVLFFEKYLS